MDVNSKKILTNSLWLYVRMLIVTFVALYTSRIVLNQLGVDDFGIYNVTGGVIAFLGVLTTSMSNASQRFFNIKKGEEDYEGLRNLYGVSRKLHLATSVLILFLAETIGLYLVVYVMSLPAERYIAAIVVYEFSILTLFFNILKVPEMAIVVTYEKFSFVAWTSLIDVFIKLAMALSLAFVSFDKLIYYGASFALLAFLQYILFAYYSKRKLIEPKNISFKEMIHSKETMSIISFSGWSMAGNFCNTLANQGINLILNVFYGLVVNAAMGITNQVTNTVATFVNNVQLAFRPQLLQSYTNEDKQQFFSLLYSTSKWSFFLIMLVAVPLLSNIHFILHIWLGNVPDYSAEFITILVFYLIIDSLSTPLYFAIEANGNIKKFQLLQSLAYIINVIFAFFVCYLGMSPTIAIATKLCTNVCIYISKLLCFRVVENNFSLREYSKQCLTYVLLVSILCGLFFYIYRDIDSTFPSFIKSCSVFFVVYFLTIIIFGLSSNEREKLFQFVKHHTNSQKHE